MPPDTLVRLRMFLSSIFLRAICVFFIYVVKYVFIYVDANCIQDPPPHCPPFCWFCLPSHLAAHCKAARASLPPNTLQRAARACARKTNPKLFYIMWHYRRNCCSPGVALRKWEICKGEVDRSIPGLAYNVHYALRAAPNSPARPAHTGSAVTS